MPDSSDTARTPYAVAMRPMELIAHGEGKPLRTAGAKSDGVNKDYVLTLYRECLEAVGSQGAVFSPRG